MNRGASNGFNGILLSKTMYALVGLRVKDACEGDRNYYFSLQRRDVLISCCQDNDLNNKWTSGIHNLPAISQIFILRGTGIFTASMLHSN